MAPASQEPEGRGMTAEASGGFRILDLDWEGAVWSCGEMDAWSGPP
jgi:hypothetical protein